MMLSMTVKAELQSLTDWKVPAFSHCSAAGSLGVVMFLNASVMNSREKDKSSNRMDRLNYSMQSCEKRVHEPLSSSKTMMTRGRLSIHLD